MTTNPQEPVRLIVGLGNPGRRYRKTRHNLGFDVVDELARRWERPLRSSECNALVAECDGVVLAQPQTYMNRSGYAVRCLAERHGCATEDVLVVYDDVALPLGKLRLRPAGSPGGHRGMESVVNNLRSDAVPRLRLGVGPADGSLAGDELVDFVLGRVTRAERPLVQDMVERAASACEVWLQQGSEVAMNEYNG
jgi:PTH1 family peptidyl-tRNA hydrolase